VIATAVPILLAIYLLTAAICALTLFLHWTNKRVLDLERRLHEAQSDVDDLYIAQGITPPIVHRLRADMGLPRAERPGPPND